MSMFPKSYRVTVTCIDIETGAPIEHTETVNAETEALAAQTIPKILIALNHNGLVTFSGGVWALIPGSRLRDLKASLSPIIQLR